MTTLSMPDSSTPCSGGSSPITIPLQVLSIPLEISLKRRVIDEKIALLRRELMEAPCYSPLRDDLILLNPASSFKNFRLGPGQPNNRYDNLRDSFEDEPEAEVLMLLNREESVEIGSFSEKDIEVFPLSEGRIQMKVVHESLREDCVNVDSFCKEEKIVHESLREDCVNVDSFCKEEAGITTSDESTGQTNPTPQLLQKTRPPPLEVLKKMRIINQTSYQDLPIMPLPKKPLECWTLDQEPLITDIPPATQLPL